MDRICIDEDNLVQWLRLRRARTGEYLNAATVSMTLKDADGNVVNGAENIALVYAAGSDGNYWGILTKAHCAVDTDETVGLEAGQDYYLHMTATQGGRWGYRVVPVEAHYHGKV